MSKIFEAAGSKSDSAIPVVCLTADMVSDSASDIVDAATRAWLETSGFKGSAGEVSLVPSADGMSLRHVCLGLGNGDDPMCAGVLPRKLPEGLYRLQALGDQQLRLQTIGFGLGAYSFDTYRKSSNAAVRLALDPSLDREAVERAVSATWLTRDLINTPANDMGPNQIELAAQTLAKAHKANIKVTRGDDLLGQNLPMIHAVGRASTDAPRLIDMHWGAKNAPKVTLVGKGVAFDTGGLDIKPASGMRNMKKDMGGAANVLGLAQMIMAAKLPVRLRVLVPAVENAIAGNAFRPGDILKSRLGKTVEIGNTDAEGRLVLADALALGDEESPDIMIDMATLTGAARVALGPDLPPYYTDDDDFAGLVAQAAIEEADPLWRLPLWQPYARNLSSTVADMNNITTDGFAGSITAALFLKTFVSNAHCWAHFDIFGWSPNAKPHAPVGGEAQGIRALFAVLTQRYAT